jgi:hypothetical protein
MNALLLEGASFDVGAVVYVWFMAGADGVFGPHVADLRHGGFLSESLHVANIGLNVIASVSRARMQYAKT